MLNVCKYYCAIAGKQVLGWEARPICSSSLLAMTSRITLTSLLEEGLGLFSQLYSEGLDHRWPKGTFYLYSSDNSFKINK